tara:strand:- start:2520 stop:2633 length:114 start_codon:yes stop_codon:yes gene_type:complete
MGRALDDGRLHPSWEMLEVLDIFVVGGEEDEEDEELS